MNKFDISLIKDFIFAVEQYNCSPNDILISEKYNEIKNRIKKYIFNLENSLFGNVLIDNDINRFQLSEQYIKDIMPIRQYNWDDETMMLWMARAVERAHGIFVANE